MQPTTRPWKIKGITVFLRISLSLPTSPTTAQTVTTLLMHTTCAECTTYPLDCYHDLAGKSSAYSHTPLELAKKQL